MANANSPQEAARTYTECINMYYHITGATNYYMHIDESTTTRVPG